MHMFFCEFTLTMCGIHLNVNGDLWQDKWM